jgi:hypothetical protein
VTEPVSGQTIPYALTRPTTLCNPARVNGSQVRFRHDRLVCYAVRRAPGAPRENRVKSLHVNHELGPGQRDTAQARELCGSGSGVLLVPELPFGCAGAPTGLRRVPVRGVRLRLVPGLLQLHLGPELRAVLRLPLRPGVRLTASAAPRARGAPTVTARRAAARRAG